MNDDYAKEFASLQAEKLRRKDCKIIIMEIKVKKTIISLNNKLQDFVNKVKNNSSNSLIRADKSILSGMPDFPERKLDKIEDLTVSTSACDGKSTTVSIVTYRNDNNYIDQDIIGIDVLNGNCPTSAVSIEHGNFKGRTQKKRDILDKISKISKNKVALLNDENEMFTESHNEINKVLKSPNGLINAKKSRNFNKSEDK